MCRSFVFAFALIGTSGWSMRYFIMKHQIATPPGPVEATVQSLADMHAQHEREIGIVQKVANHVTRALGRPAVVVVISCLIVMWIVGNLIAARMGGEFDRFPFPDLALFATVCAFLVTLLILTTQRHEQDVARRRDQLTLHMAILTENKIAKVISLLEEQRHDSSALPSRNDPQAEEMAEPSSPRSSLEKIQASGLDE